MTRVPRETGMKPAGKTAPTLGREKQQGRLVLAHAARQRFSSGFRGGVSELCMAARNGYGTPSIPGTVLGTVPGSVPGAVTPGAERRRRALPLFAGRCSRRRAYETWSLALGC